jgi:hypothetical protein
MLLEKGTPAHESVMDINATVQEQLKSVTSAKGNSAINPSTTTYTRRQTQRSSERRVTPTLAAKRRASSGEQLKRGSSFKMLRTSGTNKVSPAGFFTNTRVKSDSFEEKEIAVIIIQNAYRNMMARQEMTVIKETMRPGEGTKSDRLSGAVQLSWADITKRFARYLGDHFWEMGPVKRVNILIVETWLAHLIKARTYFLDVNGLKLPESRYHKTHKLEFHDPFELNKDELDAYNAKKTKLNSLGVTTLLAQILSSLCDDITVGGLPDRVLQLFVELLDGGHRDVQQTLFQHLTESESEGKFLAHIEKRISYAFGIYLEVKKIDASTRSISMLSHEVLEACEHLTMSFRFLQLLCEGHHFGFQNFLRQQDILHSATQVNLVKICVEHVILLCDSTSSVARFSSLEVLLVSQVFEIIIKGGGGQYM